MARANVKRKILLVDDDPRLRRLIGTTLGSDDFDVLHAADGEEALSLAREFHPALILLDVTMPKRNGFDVCQALKQDSATADIKVVILSARANDADVRLGREADADGYFNKPFSPVELLNKVYSLLA